MFMGFMYYDNDPKADLKTKVLRLAERYAARFGKRPSVCIIHPSLVPSTNGIGIEIKGKREVMPNNFWIGFDQQPAQAGRGEG